MKLPEIWYIKVFDDEEDYADTFNPVGRGAGVLARTPNYYYYYIPQCKKFIIGSWPARVLCLLLLYSSFSYSSKSS